MKVLKFGGSSVSSPLAVGNIVGILKDADHAGQVPVVVVSAMSGVTNDLIDIARAAEAGDAGFRKRLAELAARHRTFAGKLLGDELRKAAVAEIGDLFRELGRILDGVNLLGELSPRTLDLVMCFGERLSSGIIARALCENGIKAEALDARPLLKVSGGFASANYRADETFANIGAFFGGSRKKPVQVVTGFIASTLDGQTVTLGRGGSDLTASIFAAAMGADEVEIWTDVDGMYTADPRIVKTAVRVEEMLYAEAMEISHFGAKVLFPPTVMPALERGIPIVIRNTFNPSSSGTRIVRATSDRDAPIKGISSMSRVALVRLAGSGINGVGRIFGALSRARINVILMNLGSGDYSICLAVPMAEAAAAATALGEEFFREIRDGDVGKPSVQNDLSVIAVIGSAKKTASGVAGKFFHALGKAGIKVEAFAHGTSQSSISAIVSRGEEAKAVNAAHGAFFETDVRTVNVFLMGAGLIGRTLMEQIASFRGSLASGDRIRVNVAGATNSTRMVFDEGGLDPAKVPAILRGEPVPAKGRGKAAAPVEAEAADMKGFVKRMVAMNLPNSCFCDCTSSDKVAALYEGILAAGVAVVTPNKKANSGALDMYRGLTGLSAASGVPYLYGTTVCAGLPVISTMRDLRLSGDRVRRIEAVFSGTLSFIFNGFDGRKPFSALVREARDKGYTEPDPRDDLNAMDAARKALILSREIGLALEPSDVEIEPILPAACFRAKSVDAFFEELEKHDEAFEARRAEEAAKGRALRYIATIEGGKARLAIRAEPEGSPFRSLVDSDNIVVLTTDRYLKLPLVIKGPGAGAQVTAGGVFADIVRVARTPV